MLSSDAGPEESTATLVLLNGNQTLVPLDRAAAIDGGYVLLDGSVLACPTGGRGGSTDHALGPAGGPVEPRSAVPPPATGINAPIVVQCQKLCASRAVRGRRIPVLQGVDLTARMGDFVVITGRSGSGKSTLLEILAGLHRIDSGEAVVDGLALAHAREAELADLRSTRLGFLQQDIELIADLSAAENVELPLLLNGWDRSNARTEAHVTLALLGLDRLTHRTSELSGGERRRVALARALVGEPTVLWADEPTSGVDPETAGGIIELLFRLCQDGLTVIAVTHDPTLLRLATTRYEMRDGRLHRG